MNKKLIFYYLLFIIKNYSTVAIFAQDIPSYMAQSSSSHAGSRARDVQGTSLALELHQGSSCTARDVQGTSLALEPNSKLLGCTSENNILFTIDYSASVSKNLAYFSLLEKKYDSINSNQVNTITYLMWGATNECYVVTQKFIKEWIYNKGYITKKKNYHFSSGTDPSSVIKWIIDNKFHDYLILFTDGHINNEYIQKCEINFSEGAHNFNLKQWYFNNAEIVMVDPPNSCLSVGLAFIHINSPCTITTYNKTTIVNIIEVDKEACEIYNNFINNWIQYIKFSYIENLNIMKKLQLYLMQKLVGYAKDICAIRSKEIKNALIKFKNELIKQESKRSEICKKAKYISTRVIELINNNDETKVFKIIEECNECYINSNNELMQIYKVIDKNIQLCNGYLCNVLSMNQLSDLINNDLSFSANTDIFENINDDDDDDNGTDIMDTTICPYTLKNINLDDIVFCATLYNNQTLKFFFDNEFNNYKNNPFLAYNRISKDPHICRLILNAFFGDPISPEGANDVHQYNHDKELTISITRRQMVGMFCGVCTEKERLRRARTISRFIGVKNCGNIIMWEIVILKMLLEFGSTDIANSFAPIFTKAVCYDATMSTSYSSLTALPLPNMQKMTVPVIVAFFIVATSIYHKNVSALCKLGDTLDILMWSIKTLGIILPKKILNDIECVKMIIHLKYYNNELTRDLEKRDKFRIWVAGLYFNYHPCNINIPSTATFIALEGAPSITQIKWFIDNWENMFGIKQAEFLRDYGCTKFLSIISLIEKENTLEDCAQPGEQDTPGSIAWAINKYDYTKEVYDDGIRQSVWNYNDIERYVPKFNLVHIATGRPPCILKSGKEWKDEASKIYLKLPVPGRFCSFSNLLGDYIKNLNVIPANATELMIYVQKKHTMKYSGVNAPYWVPKSFNNIKVLPKMSVIYAIETFVEMIWLLIFINNNEYCNRYIKAYDLNMRKLIETSYKKKNNQLYKQFINKLIKLLCNGECNHYRGMTSDNILNKIWKDKINNKEISWLDLINECKMKAAKIVLPTDISEEWELIQNNLIVNFSK